MVFAGQPVAAVAADELAIAEEALDLIDVEYEVLPAAVDPIASMQPGAPRVAEAGTEADTSEALAHSAVAARPRPTRSSKAVNIAQQARLQRGDVAKGLAESDLMIEKTYHVPMVHQGYLEPHAALADWDTQRRSPSGRAPRARSTPAPRSPTSSRSPRTRIKVIPAGVRRRLRRQDPRAVRADHRAALAAHRAARAATS